MPVVGVVLHQVPDDRAVADRHHRLGDVLGVIAEAKALAAAEEDDFHGIPDRSPTSRSTADARCPHSAAHDRLSSIRRPSTTRAAGLHACESVPGRPELVPLVTSSDAGGAFERASSEIIGQFDARRKNLLAPRPTAIGSYGADDRALVDAAA